MRNNILVLIALGLVSSTGGFARNLSGAGATGGEGVATYKRVLLKVSSASLQCDVVNEEELRKSCVVRIQALVPADLAQTAKTIVYLHPETESPKGSLRAMVIVYTTQLKTIIPEPPRMIEITTQPIQTEKRIIFNVLEDARYQ